MMRRRQLLPQPKLVRARTPRAQSFEFVLSGKDELAYHGSFMWCILSPTEFWSRFIRTSWTWFLSAIVWFPMRVACRTRYWRRRFWPASHMFGLTYQYSCFVRSGGCLLPSTFSNGYYYQNFYVHFCIDLAFMDLSLHMYLPVTFRMFMFHKHQRSHSCSMHIASSLVLVFGTSTKTASSSASCGVLGWLF